MRFIKKNEEVLGLSICKKGQIMENQKNEFDDIILEKSNKSEKVKKILFTSYCFSYFVFSYHDSYEAY